MKQIVVNLFGEPGVGKSTLAMEVVASLKKLGISAEYAPEFAKDLIYDENENAFKCQDYLFGNQVYRLHRLKDKVQVIVTDSPLPLSIVFDEKVDVYFHKHIINVFNEYQNINLFLERDFKYEQDGRHETEQEAKEVREKIKNCLKAYEIDVIPVKKPSSKIVIDIIKEKIKGLLADKVTEDFLRDIDNTPPNDFIKGYLRYLNEKFLTSYKRRMNNDEMD